MRGTNHTIIVIIVIVITFYLLRPQYRSASSEKKCQTVILPRVIEKSSCDPCFTSPYSMSTNQLNVLVSLMIAIAFLVTESRNAQADGYPQHNQKQTIGVPQKYCGKKLSNALQVVCDGVYNSMFKKSDQEMEMADYPFAYDSPPFLPRARARGMLNGPFAGRRYRRESRGIHEECCLNACTINELSSYCGAL